MGNRTHQVLSTATITINYIVFATYNLDRNGVWDGNGVKI